MIRFKELVLVLTLVLVAGTACTTVSKQSPAMKAVNAQFTVDAETMRVRTRTLGPPFAGYIEESGDRILSEADDPQVRRQALIWKADGLPTVRAALFRPDPLTALLDTWALTEQLIDYFGTGPGRDRLGESAVVALEAVQQMRADVIEVMEMVVQEEDLERGETYVNQWAAEHPIVDSIAGRKSILREVGTFKVKSGTGGLKVVGTLAVTMDDMLKQVEAYTANIPKQARWEAELAVMEMVGPENYARSIELLPTLLDTAAELGGTMEELPALVSRERQAVLDALRRERIESLVFLRQERLETLDRISAERVAVLENTDAMRLAVTEALHQEVLEVTELIREQRARTMVEAEEIAGRTLGQTFENATELVGHVFLRIVILLLLVFAGCVLLILLAWRLFRPRPAVA